MSADDSGVTVSDVKESVNKHLESRPTKAELQQREIIQQGNVSDSLAGRAKELELKKNKDKVSIFLKKNPEKVSIYKTKSMNNGLPDNLQGTAKTLEFKITEDRINFLLKNRPTLEELEEQDIIKIETFSEDGDDKKSLRSDISKFLASRPSKESIKEFLQYAHVSNSLAGTAKDLEKKMAIDKLSAFIKENSKKTKQELQQQTMYENVANSLAGTAQTLKKQMVKDKVQKLVRQNSQRPNSIKKTNSFSNAIAAPVKTMEFKLAEAKVNKSLKERPSMKNLEERQILQLDEMEANAEDATADNAAVQAEDVDSVNDDAQAKTSLTENMNKFLETRPDKSELQQKDLISGVANPIAGAAKTLRNQMVKDKVQKIVRQNSQRVSSIKKTNSLSNVIAASTKTMEFKFAEAHVNYLLKERPTLKELEERNIIKLDELEADIDSDEKENLRTTMNEFLASRPSKEEIQEFLHYASVSDALVPVALNLERQLAKDKLSSFIRENNKEGFIKKTNSVSDRLQAPVKSLSMKMTEDKVNKAMRDRPSKGELQKQSIMEEDVAPLLAGAAKTLRKQMVKDKVQKIVRQNSQRVSSIKKTNSLSNAIAGTGKTMEFKFAEAHVSFLLKNRPTLAELEEREIIKIDALVEEKDDDSAKEELKAGISDFLASRPSKDEVQEFLHYANVSSSLAGTAKALEKKMATDKLGSFLKQRPSRQEVHKQNMYENVADSLAGTAKDLRKQMVKDKVQKIVRQNSQRVSSIKKTNSLSNAIAGTGKTMEFKFAEAHVSFLLKNRPTLAELEEKQIIKIDALVEEKDDDSAKEELKAGISDFLASRPSKDEVQEFLHYANVSSSLAGTAKALEKKMATDKLGSFLKQRPSKQEVHKQNMYENVADSLAGTAKDLRKQMVKDKVQKIVRQNSQRVSSIKKTNSLSNAIAAPAKTMEFKFAEANVNFLLKNRPTLQELEAKNIIQLEKFEAVMDPEEKKILRTNINSFLASRPNKEQIVEFLEYANVSDSIAATAKGLQRKIARNRLNKLMKRQDREVVSANLRKTQAISAQLHGPAKVLEFKLTEDKVSRGIKDRPSKDDMEARELIPTDAEYDNILVKDQNTKEMVKSKNTLRRMYSNRPEKEDLKKSQIMKDFKGELAPALQGSATQLEAEMNKNKLSAMVKGPTQPVDLLDL